MPRIPISFKEANARTGNTNGVSVATSYLGRWHDAPSFCPVEALPNGRNY